MKTWIHFVCLALTASSSAPARAEPPQSCAEYRAWKRSFMLFEQEVVGRSCELVVEVVPVGTDRYRIKASFDWDSVDSGSTTRDRHVAEHFANGGRSRVEFESEAIADRRLHELAQGHVDMLHIPGRLRIGPSRAPVTFEARPASKGRFVGQVSTGFAALGIEPPRAAGGFVAKVRDPLRLSFELDVVAVSMKRALALRALYDDASLREVMR